MSLIADALKTAQRERQRREAESASETGAPLVVPLRGKSAPAFSWLRALSLGVGGAMVVAIVLVGLQVRKSAGRPPLPAVPVPPAADLIVAPSSAASPAADSAASPKQSGAPAASAGGTQADGRTAKGASRGSTQRVRRPGTAVASVPAAQSASRTAPGGGADSSARERVAAFPQGVQSAAGARAEPSNRLRIAMDQPRGPEAARLFADAVVAHRANDLATARDLYERLLVLTPNDPDLLNNFGVLLSSQREYGRATELLKRAVALAPANAGAWANLGFSLREQSRSAEAIAAFQHALALDPARPAVRISLAQQYIAMGSLDQARAVVDRLLADDPSSAEAHYTRGQLYEMQGDPAAAAREYEDFLRLAGPRLAAYAERVRRHLDTLAARTRAP